MANVRFAATTRGFGKTKCDTRGLARSIIVSDPSFAFWSPDIFRCADSADCGWAPVRSFEFRNLPVRLPFSGYWSENGIGAHQDRTKFARPIHNRASPWGNQAWRWLRQYRGLPLVVYRREFLRPNQCPGPPGAYKRERHRLLRKSGEARHATDCRNRIGASRRRRR